MICLTPPPSTHTPRPGRILAWANRKYIYIYIYYLFRFGAEGEPQDIISKYLLSDTSWTVRAGSVRVNIVEWCLVVPHCTTAKYIYFAIWCSCVGGACLQAGCPRWWAGWRAAWFAYLHVVFYWFVVEFQHFHIVSAWCQVLKISLLVLQQKKHMFQMCLRWSQI